MPASRQVAQPRPSPSPICAAPSIPAALVRAHTRALWSRDRAPGNPLRCTDEFTSKPRSTERQAEFLCEPRQSLLECLRDIVGLTGAKEGCNDGNCGACTVILWTAASSIPAWCSAWKRRRRDPHDRGHCQGGATASAAAGVPEEAALQCGICTPGFIVAAKALLDQEPDPSETRDPPLAGEQSLPLHRLRQDRARGAAGRRDEMPGR